VRWDNRLDSALRGRSDARLIASRDRSSAPGGRTGSSGSALFLHGQCGEVGWRRRAIIQLKKKPGGLATLRITSPAAMTSPAVSPLRLVQQRARAGRAGPVLAQIRPPGPAGSTHLLKFSDPPDCACARRSRPHRLERERPLGISVAKNRRAPDLHRDWPFWVWRADLAAGEAPPAGAQASGLRA